MGLDFIDTFWTIKERNQSAERGKSDDDSSNFSLSDEAPRAG